MPRGLLHHAGQSSHLVQSGQRLCRHKGHSSSEGPEAWTRNWGEAAYVHAVAGTRRKRYGCMFAATGRPQGLEAHAALTLGGLRRRNRRIISAWEAGGDGTERDDTDRGDARPSRCWPSAVPASASSWMGTLPRVCLPRACGVQGGPWRRTLGVGGERRA